LGDSSRIHLSEVVSLDLLDVIVMGAADGALELSESLAERATGFGQPSGPEDQERNDEDNDQVGGLQDAGEHEMSFGGVDRARGGERGAARPEAEGVRTRAPCVWG
jgi:hypothetical protein